MACSTPYASWNTLKGKPNIGDQINKKIFGRLHDAIQGEIDRVSQRLAQRVRELAERYADPLPTLTERTGELEARVNAHLEKMGFAV